MSVRKMPTISVPANHKSKVGACCRVFMAGHAVIVNSREWSFQMILPLSLSRFITTAIICIVLVCAYFIPGEWVNRFRGTTSPAISMQESASTKDS